MPDSPEMTRLPYVDTHSLAVVAPRATVWTALESYVEEWLRRVEGSPAARLLGTVPAAAFEVVERVEGRRLALGGRHRFARYRLVFELTDEHPVTTLSARTEAAFPGPHGQLYRLLVVGSRGHVLVTRALLRGVRSRAEAA